jgi:hypothetical protein
MNNRIFGPNGQLLPQQPKNEKTNPFDALHVSPWLEEERQKKLRKMITSLGEYRAEVMGVQHNALQRCLPEYRERLRGYFIAQLQAFELVEGLAELSLEGHFATPQGWVNI